jgi:hypothetical protein
MQHPLWREDGFVSYEYAWSLSSVRIAHMACYWKFFLLHYIQVLCQCRLCKADHASPTYLVLQRQLGHSNGRKLGRHQVQVAFIFSMSNFVLSYATNMSILMILYDIRLLPAQFCYVMVYMRKVESRVQIADRCAPWKISNNGQNLVLQARQF